MYLTKEDLNKKHTFKRCERLKSKKTMASLFQKGSLFVYKKYLLRYICKPSDYNSIQIAFSVPKKKINKAVHRNYIKRCMREVYRKHKYILLNKKCFISKELAILLIYNSSSKETYEEIKKEMLALFNTFKSN